MMTPHELYAASVAGGAVLGAALGVVVGWARVAWTNRPPSPRQIERRLEANAAAWRRAAGIVPGGSPRRPPTAP